MRVKSHHIGHTLSLRFWDHSLGPDADLIECSVVGVVVSVSNIEVVLEYWTILSGDSELQENNRERVAIIQSSIIALIELSPKRGQRFY